MINISKEEGAMGVKPTGPLCEVKAKGVIEWDATGLQVVGKSERGANDEVVKFRRLRRQ